MAAYKLIRKANKGIMYHSKETDMHLIIKILLQKKLLINPKRKVLTEERIRDRIIDCIDYDKGVLYEIESKKTQGYEERLKEFGSDMMLHTKVIKLYDMPEHLKKAIEEISEWLDQQRKL